MEFLIVGFGGFCGAIARYLIYVVERSIGNPAFPFGTLLINILGCLLAGFLSGAVERGLPIHRNLILLGSIGLIGSFTTFSTFSTESVQLIRSNQIVFAIISMGANMALGIGAVFLGRFVILKF